MNCAIMATSCRRLSVSIALFLFIIFSSSSAKQGGKDASPAKQDPNDAVIYDARSLIIKGQRELLFSGSIHYTRSTPEMWPDLIDKARKGGLNVIQTYVFWNAHEAQKGKWTFEGQFDLIKFLKLVHEKGMYVTLRLGPFIQAEWNHGGLPYWLREVPNIIFRSNNEPFKQHMKEFTTKIIGMMKEAKMFAGDGGPIILAQIENEYNHVQLAYRDQGDKYVQWAAQIALEHKVGVPWVMCKQKDAPDPVINACNGRHCGDTFSGPNKPYKPALWTENWTAQYRVFGDPPSQRSAEDIAFSVARFFSKDGSLVNYYMYHGGTNFGRTSSAFSTTRYYDEAPLDEYGLPREPKWSHLRDLHRALNLCKRPLFNGVSSVQKLNDFHEIRVYEKADNNLCAAFLTNNHSTLETNIKFRGQDYYLPAHSISILPDCKTVVFNTQNIVSQHSFRNLVKSPTANNHNWEMVSEPIPTVKQAPVDSKFPQELYSMLKDTTDYGWYTTSIELGPEDLPMKAEITPVLRIISLGHSLTAFVNGEYIGAEHGTHEEKGFEFQKPAKFKVGINHITILASLMGLPDSGAYMEHRYAGPKTISILGLNTGTIDLTLNGWGHKVALVGEKDMYFTEQGSKKVKWNKVSGEGPPVTWYKTTFNAPEGTEPIAIRMTGMGKGIIWVNGQSIGRHWMTFLSPLGKPTQSEYHIPRAWVKPNDNLLVILEEQKANPKEIEILTIDRDTICSVISEKHPPNVKSFAVKGQKFQVVDDDLMPQATVRCPNHKRISAVDFASFGDPIGFCGAYSLGKCNAPEIKQIAEKQCLGQNSCTLKVDRKLYNKNGDPCPNLMVKTLILQVKCASKG